MQQHRPTGRRLLRPDLIVVVAALFAGGCTPTCGQVCHKLLDCGNLGTERVAFAQCEESCLDQRAVLEDWEDEAQIDAFDDHRRCLASSSCEEIEDGTCYDEVLFSF